MAAAGEILAAASMLLCEGAPGVTTASSTRPPSGSSARRAPSRLQGLPRLPGLDLRLAQLDGRARHPRRYELGRGDILSIDIGVDLDGWVADARDHGPDRDRSPRSPARCSRPRGALFDAVEQCRPGNRLGDVSHAVQTRVEADGFSVIRSLVGHGIGRDMHEDPQIPNFGQPGTGPSWRRAWCWRSSRWSTPAATHDPHGRRQLGRLLPGRLAGRPLRAHGRGHRGRPADPHPVARGGTGRPPAWPCRHRGARLAQALRFVPGLLLSRSAWAVSWAPARRSSVDRKGSTEREGPSVRSSPCARSARSSAATARSS